MADGRHSEKSKIGHISATVWPIGTKFDALTLIVILAPLKCRISKIQDDKRPQFKFRQKRNISAMADRSPGKWNDDNIGRMSLSLY